MRLTAPEVEVLKFRSLSYTAEILWLPTDKVVVLKVATPEAFSVPVPRTVVPSLNETVPEGVPTPGELAVTVPVNVTDWPKIKEVALEVRTEVVAA